MFSVRLIPHPNGSTAHQLFDAFVAVRDGIKALGLADPAGRQIIIGGNIAGPKVLPTIPDGSVVWNLEQVGTFHFSPEYVTLLRRCEVWDYNPVNRDRLSYEYGIRAKLLPMGWVPTLSESPLGLQPDYDVMFVGAQTPKRLHVIDQLRLRGMNVYFSNACYGPLRNEMHERSRVVLNMHAYDAKVLESVRLVAAMARRRPVVTQMDPDTASEPDLAALAVCAPYEQLVERVVELVGQPGRRERLAERGLEGMKARRMETFLEKVL